MSPVPSIRDLPLAERPRERLQSLGAGALSSVELLAVILGRGVAGEPVLQSAQRLIAHFGGPSGIACASVEELSKLKGIGLAKACQLKAAFELAKRAGGIKGEYQPCIKTPEDVFQIIYPLVCDEKKEYFFCLMLDVKSRLIRVGHISVGSLEASVVHPREVFKEALSASAASVILAHNHPSGDTEPSHDDIGLSARLREAGGIMGIEVLDHIIIGGQSFTSLKRQGLL